MTARFELTDRIVVITGGLGQLGSAFRRALSAERARVVVLDVAASPPSFEDSSIYLQADVTDRASLERALAELARDVGIPHVLINNAALDSPPDAPADENGPFETYPEGSWDRVLEVNLKGTFLACQVFGGAMAEAGRGSIINISSIYGLVSPDQRLYEHRRREGSIFFKPAAYAASKSGVLNLTRYLATYWAARAVRVNTLSFGGVFNHQAEEFLTAYCSRVPLGRMASAEDYIGAVIFLASDASAYMTGANLVIDGGWTAW